MHNLSLELEVKLFEVDSAGELTGRLPKVSSSSGRVYYVKTGSPYENEQYAGEGDSLSVIESAAPGLAPRLLSYGSFDDGRPYFISEYRFIGSLTTNTAVELGRRLALELHDYKSQNGFGFATPTYCGVTRIANGWFASWGQCYSAMVEGLVTQLRGKEKYETLCKNTDLVIQNVIPRLLGPLEIQPVLLHGDLWSGNVGVDEQTGQPVIFDPASYFGHNEADLAIARIFGGFPEAFFMAYHKFRPKTEPVSQYSLRGDLYELFHYLNHTLIFGGHYARSAEGKIQKLLAADF